jgi:UDPglucose--hexose-1-phosphate uridylyltransferase
MSELRHDPIQRQWVIVATERGARPSGFQVHVTEPQPEFCPLCPTNEAKTPPEIFAVREGFSAPNSPGWSLRVVPNKYPAVSVHDDLQRSAVGVYDWMSGVGAHEIIVETPKHDQHLADQPLSQFSTILKAYRDRMRALLEDTRFLFAMVFRNQGESAGATLAHPHAQVMALPILPNVTEVELHSAREHFRRTERCLFCDVLKQEEEAKERMVVRGDRFSVFAPFASRSPYELSVLPVFHQSEFTQLTDDDAEELASTLSEALRRLKKCLHDPPFNFIIHSAPNPASQAVAVRDIPAAELCYHWHIELIPRLTRSAGFEWGTGFYINPTPPEDAADNLRSVTLV